MAPMAMSARVPTPAPSVDCGTNQHSYRLSMYDTEGDGWQGVSFTVSVSTTATVVASGALDDGASGDAWMCLVDGCYLLEVDEGSPGRYAQISFELVDELGGQFQDLTAPFSGSFCAAWVDVYGHPTTQPTTPKADDADLTLLMSSALATAAASTTVVVGALAIAVSVLVCA